uniref:Uncharacterized protein n=1 Tax=Helianthus annuus TaxID=4232 RepID=A0A251UF66_HELAN
MRLFNLKWQKNLRVFDDLVCSRRQPEDEPKPAHRIGCSFFWLHFFFYFIIVQLPPTLLIINLTSTLIHPL